MKTKPLISILTSSWNREKYLKKLTESLKKQSYKNFEWIVGNDGSDDGTDKFIRDFSKKSKFKITYINSSMRVGKAKLTNIMLKKISGKYTIECDSDDYLDSKALENLLYLTEDKRIKNNKNFGAIVGQNISTNKISQTFKTNKIPKNIELLNWNNLHKKIDGDATFLVLSKNYKNKQYLEVDFLITESSLLNKVFKNKIFLLTPKIIKIMNRNAKNSVTFSKKMRYTRGSAYCVAINETKKNFNSKKLTLKIKTILHFWRYTLHGDLSFMKALNMVKPLKNNYLYSLLYPISYIIYLIDLIFDKVEKTHIEFEKNIKIAKIKTEIFNK